MIGAHRGILGVGLVAGLPAFPLVGQVFDRPPATIIVYEGTDEVRRQPIEERLRAHNIVLRLDLPPANQMICQVKEVLADMMAEKGFADAEITHEIVSMPRDPATVKLAFDIKEGARSRNGRSIPNRLSPAERCAR